MEAEDLDAVTPMAADLHTRHTDAQWEGRPTQTFFASPGKTGAFATFVRPIRVIDPFTAVNPGSVPNRLAVDAVLGLVDGLEVFCLWISELGTSKFCISY